MLFNIDESVLERDYNKHIIRYIVPQICYPIKIDVPKRSSAIIFHL